MLTMYAIFSKYKHYLRLKAVINPRNAKNPLTKKGFSCFCLESIQRGSIIGRWLALIGAGSSLFSLERYSSTATAQERPSAMAQTTRL